ncbi:MAG: hypothetical protein N2312_05575 [Dictyoglomaceae bacterium]|nr:hypothetical protein [Dictyoglomaceae bacterium]
MRIFRLIATIIFLIFLAIFINNRVLKLKSDNKELLREITILEKEKVNYEDLLLKKINLNELENKARKMGLQYPEEILEIEIDNGKVIDFKKDKYYISSYNNKP